MRSTHRALLLAAALVPLGTIAGHVGGYVLAGRHAGLEGTHSHLRPTAWLAAVAAAAALGWVACARGPRRARMPVAWLAAGQAVLFLGLESVEHLVAGQGVRHLLVDPGLRWGLLAQVAVAAALVLAAALARASGDRVRALLAGRARPVTTLAPACHSVTAVVRSITISSSATERGPPRALVFV